MATPPWKTLLNRWNPSSRYDSSVAKEYDDHVRPADLWLYCSPVGGCSGTNDHPSTLYRQARTGEPLSQYAHWILVFKYQDRTIAAIDGNNENDKLVPSYWKSIDESWTEVKYITTLDISPKEVREIAVSHPLNGKDYFLWGSNCHIWANRVLKYLGLDELPNTIDYELLVGTAVAVRAVSKLFNSAFNIF